MGMGLNAGVSRRSGVVRVLSLLGVVALVCGCGVVGSSGGDDDGDPVGGSSSGGSSSGGSSSGGSSSGGSSSGGGEVDLGGASDEERTEATVTAFCGYLQRCGTLESECSGNGRGEVDCRVSLTPATQIEIQECEVEGRQELSEELNWSEVDDTELDLVEECLEGLGTIACPDEGDVAELERALESQDEDAIEAFNDRFFPAACFEVEDLFGSSTQEPPEPDPPQPGGGPSGGAGSAG